MNWSTILAASIWSLTIAQADPVPQPAAPPSETAKTQIQTADEKAALEKFEKRLAEVDAKMAAITDLSADFEQKKKTALLKKPMLSSGSVLCKAEKVLWHTTQPRKNTMLVADGKVTVYYPDDKLAEIYSMGTQFRDAAGGPLPRLSKLRETFDFVEVEAAEFATGEDAKTLASKIAIKLTPRSDELKKHIASVRVLINESVPCADRIVLVDPEGDETELRFTKVEINKGVKDEEVDLKLPEGTKISTPTGSGK